MSVNRNVTTPEGGSPADTRTGCHTKPCSTWQSRLTFETLVCRPYLLCRGSLPLALCFEPPRGSGYGFYVVAGCDGQNRLAARCPATTRPLIERCAFWLGG